ncbi:MAG: flagellar protein FlgN [Magnetococcus sp. DMHC-6]
MDTTNDDIKQTTDHLNQTLQHLMAQFENLLILFNQEKEAILQRNSIILKNITTQINQALTHIREADQNRQQLSHALALALNINSEELTLAHIDQALGGNTGLIQIRLRLRELIQQANKLNKENQAILNGVLMATETVIQAVKNSTRNAGASYNRLGHRQAGNPFHLFSRQL